MLYKIATIALALVCGAFAQDSRNCTGQVVEEDFDNCGRIGTINVYWTSSATQTDILFEMVDDMYYSFGFTPERESANAMNNAQVLFGCSDATLPIPIEQPVNILLPATRADRTPEGIQAGLNQTQIFMGTPVMTRLNGICGIRFQRLNTLPAGVAAELNLINGTQNGIVWARGDQQALARHTDRGFGLQDFIANTGILTDNNIVLFNTTMPDIPANTTATVMPTTPDGTDSANVASLSSMLAGAVAALTIALW